MEKLTDVLSMGGYGAYVWPAFLLTALAMLAMAAASVRALKAREGLLAQLSSPRDET